MSEALLYCHTAGLLYFTAVLLLTAVRCLLVLPPVLLLQLLSAACCYCCTAADFVASAAHCSLAGSVVTELSININTLSSRSQAAADEPRRQGGQGPRALVRLAGGVWPPAAARGGRRLQRGGAAGSDGGSQPALRAQELGGAGDERTFLYHALLNTLIKTPNISKFPFLPKFRRCA